MPYQCCRLIHNTIATRQSPIKELVITATPGGCPAIQRFIEKTNVFDGTAANRHVYSGSDLSSRQRIHVGEVKPFTHKAPTKAIRPLKPLLCFSFQL